LSSAPAATHAFTSDVACAFEVGPPGGIGPPLHEKRDATVDCVPLMNEYEEMKLYAVDADVTLAWQDPQLPMVPGARYCE
jgi:hypothetical protein